MERKSYKLPKNNTSGYKGVSWIEKRKKWSATVRKNGQNIRVGHFNTKEEAYQAYLDAGGKPPLNEEETFDKLKYNKEYVAKNRKKVRENFSRYVKENHRRIRDTIRKNNQKLRLQVIEAYGSKCDCCGETIHRFLTVDHIDGRGSEHRKEIGGTDNLYRWLIKNNFPKDNFRLLCWNCNCGRAYNNGICPHKEQEFDLNNFAGNSEGLILG